MRPSEDSGSNKDMVSEGAGGLSSLRKAAILVVSLEESLAALLLSRLDRVSVEAVSLEMAHLDRIAVDEQEAVLEEFFALSHQRLCFAFEDLVEMDDKEIRLAYHEEDAALWTLCLAGATRALQRKVFGALEPRAAQELKQRLEGQGPFRVADVETAQAELAERLRCLHDEGRIRLPDPEGREEILV